MKVWIDVANSPQVAFVLPFIAALENQNHEIVVTSRPHANTEQLLLQRNVRFQSIGGHYGKSKFAKILGLLKRSWSLYKCLKDQNISCAFSQSSFYSPLVAWLLGIRSIYTNDNEYAKGNYIAALFATECYFPNSWPDIYLKRINKANLYMGVKESVYMCEFSAVTSRADRIYYRPEAWDAEYYSIVESKKVESMLSVLTSISVVVILPRSKDQVEFFRSLGNGNIVIQEEPLGLDEIISDALLFVGSGGSMSRELALTKVPTITCYGHGLLSVDSELIDAKVLNFVPLIKFNKNYVLSVIDKPKRADLENISRQGVIFKNDVIQRIGSFL